MATDTHVQSAVPLSHGFGRKILFLNTQSTQIKSLKTAFPTKANKVQGKKNPMLFFNVSRRFFLQPHILILEHIITSNLTWTKPEISNILGCRENFGKSHGHAVSPSCTDVIILIRLCILLCLSERESKCYLPSFPQPIYQELIRLLRRQKNQLDAQHQF